MNIFRIVRAIYHKILTLYYRNVYNLPKSVVIKGVIHLNANSLSVGDNVTLFTGVNIWGPGKIVIGNNSSIGEDTIIVCANEITIGNDVLIAAQSYIIDCDHGMMRNELIRKQPLISEPIYIGNDIWIGAGAKILKGSYISDGAVIGALGLVKGYIEPYSINVGIPTRKMAERQE